MEHGISGKIANTFIQSKLSILLVFAFLLLGIFSIYFIPREEDPQIEVPTADILLGYPGANPQEIESRIVQPMEKITSNIKGVEHVYSTSMNGRGMLTVQFYVGQDPERSMVKLYNEIIKNMDHMPPGMTMPLIKSRSIDDVPVLAFTLWSNKMSGYELRQVSEVVGNEIKKIPNVAQVKITGGQKRQIRVILDKDKMAESHVDFETIAQALQANNVQAEGGNIITGDQVYSVRTGNFFTNEDDVKNMIVGTDHDQPVYLYQVAKVTDGPGEPRQYVSFSYGAAETKEKVKMPDDYSAVTVSIAKKKGADAMKLADAVISKVKHLKENVITNDIHVNITRNYGATASQKVSELLLHLIIAIIAVTLFVMLAMGWRGGLVVFMSIPITFALTLFAYYFLGYTLNRITLFALVFVTGIVVDDSIVIAENMHRHFKMQNLPPLQAAIFAINEVGNPTILATLTVIAAVLPMAFVSGMMGPYMSPMPIGAAIAMTFSLLIALTLTPYFGYHFLRFKEKRQDNANKKDSTTELHETKIYKAYAQVITPLLQSRKKRWAFMLSLAVVLFATFTLFFTKSVPVKMLPFDNKNEFQVIVDMPEGTSLERTDAVTKELGVYISQNDKVTNYQTYAGTSSPINFNGLIRHYDLRFGNNVADIQVNLIDKKKRREQSHDIAKAMRPALQAIGKKYHANVKVVEVPPGPPVMSTIVAEIYGPDYNQQVHVARQVKNMLSHTDNVADVDWSVEANQVYYKFVVDKDKSIKLGIPENEILQEVKSALSGMTVGTLHQPASIDPIGIVLQLPEKERSDITDILNLKVITPKGLAVPIGDLVKVTKGLKDKSISHKDQKRVVYVTADVAGKLESPIYAMTAISKKLSKIKLPEGYHLQESYKGQPAKEDNFTLKWDGEWKITYDVFRDLGIAFLFVLIIIYILIVAWFQNFITPLVQLSAIPLSLIGIILGHWIMGAYFSAPSMIGFIALAGIMVRNSILLIDFIDLQLQRGIPLKQAIVESGAVRTTPILLTAGGVVISAIVILFDPIFQGLAISLIGGTITSTILTLIVVPILYFKMLKNKVK
ncbi:MAG: efflux RND transporter permease subunit [Prevotella sp.]|jgi:multidrug efflux pump subunit AcrB|nr:efflux RND transporter permease subunit [Prevotella sp.]MCH4183166.1 efflux RND transporter permease subunit [Prevotella sp.]MCH4212712.1 efflux RND transporter permease subunit [Prevotella sp.]MCH4241757.1 efflux RND transporter permease subunit [Prevotella sp.]